MQARIDVARVSPDAYKAMLGMQGYVNASGLEKSLLELVKTRASQINGCAFCLHMRTRDAREAGESQERLDLLAAWREARLLPRSGARRSRMDRGDDARCRYACPG